MPRLISQYFFFLLYTSLLLHVSGAAAQPANKAAAVATATEIEYAGSSQKFALMIGTTAQFESAVVTAEQMQLKERGFAYEIVVYGELAKALADDSSLLNLIDRSEKMGVKIVICEIALEFFGVSKKQLDPRLSTTPNAWIYMFELKDSGYNTLSL